MLENIWNAITCLPMDWLWFNLGGHIPSRSRHVRHDAVAMAVRPLPRNSALNILQLWASGGRTREPILMKFGKQQQIRTTMTVTWSNVKIFKIQNGGRTLLENIRSGHNSPANGPTGTQLGWSHPIMFPTLVASKQHICCKTVSLVLVVTVNRAVNFLVLWGVEIKNIHNFAETWMTVPLW